MVSFIGVKGFEIINPYLVFTLQIRALTRPTLCANIHSYMAYDWCTHRYPKRFIDEVNTPMAYGS